MTELRASNVTVTVGTATLVRDASVVLKAGELVAVLGPNGAGKTTLLRAMLGLLPTSAGTAWLDGNECRRLSPIERAKRVSYLPQRRPLAWPNRVKDVVALGRFAHGVALGRLSPQDAAAVDAAIESCDLAVLATRQTDSLSGGELARVHFARAIAARTPLLVADEPVAALDPRHQIGIAKLIRDYVDQGGGALVVLHDVALAARIADRLVWMQDGSIVSEGSPQDTLTAQNMRDVFGVHAQIVEDSLGFDVRVEGAV